MGITRNKEIQLFGSWKAGWALDLHTIDSTVLANGTFNTTYTDIGFALNRLKYSSDSSKIEFLSNAVVNFMGTRMVTPYLNVIIPTPASKSRDIQPVYEVALSIGKKLGIPVDFNYLIKIKSTNQLKSINDVDQRKQALDGAFSVADTKYRAKKVLLFDDLFRSGSTLNELTKVLYSSGYVQNVYVVTLTKTRSKR